MKAWVSNRIRDPGSPRRDPWMLIFLKNTKRVSANAVNILPEYYGRKAETQSIWREIATVVEYVV